MIGRGISRSGLAIVAIGFVVLFVSGGSRHAIGLVLKPMADTFDWERSTLGAAIALFLFVSALCMFFAGHLADRISLRTILGGGLFVSAIGIGLMSLVSEPWHAFLFYGVAFAIGNGIASVPPICAMVARQFPDNAGMANSIAISGMGLGQLLIIAVLAAVLVGDGWRSVFIWLGAINLLLVPFVLWAVSRSDTATGNATAPIAGPLIRDALRTQHFWILLAVYALCGFQDFFASTHVVAFALDQEMPALFAGNLLAFMGLAGLVGVIAAGTWSDRFSPVSATVICFIIRTAIFAMILISKDQIAVTAFAILFGFTYWITAPLTVVFVRNAFGVRNLGALSGLITMVHHMCGGIGAWTGAVMFDTDGSYDTPFMIMLGCSLTAILLSFGLRAAPRLGGGQRI
jgi:predicted MFS family arabinose efflux permease